MKLKKQPSNNKTGKIIFFSGMVVEMAVIIGAGAWLGNYLDLKYNNNPPWLTVVFSLSAVFLSLYHTIRQIQAWQKRNES